MYEVQLANCGNIDRWQDPDRALPGTESGNWVPVETLREASNACRAYIEENDLGGGNWAGGDVRLAGTDEIIATISYNGRAWSPIPEGGTWDTKLALDLDDPFPSTAPKA